MPAQLQEIYSILSIALGTPPKADESFTFEYYDKDGKFHSYVSLFLHP
jgi:bleomycin hydrolase